MTDPPHAGPGDTVRRAALRRVRLARAHADLLAAEPHGGVRVQGVARRWGFAKPGSFSVVYRALYGRSPCGNRPTPRAERPYAARVILPPHQVREVLTRGRGAKTWPGRTARHPRTKDTRCASAAPSWPWSAPC
ncbi:helix-turn-helix domain-containing protein [Streptomyces sp. NPDC047014]|uniref:helix-turn-helix domain-containing protein n=1 Tax=Streptomyces sp. NPDC047014 TaxID=3155736 RepID=UPI0033F11C75